MPDHLPLAQVAEKNLQLPEVQLAELPAAPGRAASALEARQMLATNGPVADAEVIARMLAIPKVSDEIDNATAMALASRSNGAGAFMPFDGDQPGATPGLLGIEVETAEHQNLPDVIRKSVFGIDYDESSAPLPDAPRWLALHDLPGYMADFIRALGRSTFKSFPCFKKHDRLARSAGCDPLGSMRVLANLQGRGPTPQRELDAMALWIRNNGVPVEAGHIEFPIAIPGYSPRIILAGNDTTSFLLIDEKRTDGAPVDAQYIYAWAGGRRHYLANPQDLVELNAPVAKQVVAAPGGHARRNDGGADPEAAALRNIARIGRPTLNLSNGIPKTAQQAAQKAAVKALPVASDANPEMVMSFRRAGFRPDGPQTELRLKRFEADGRVSILTRNPDFATGAFLLSIQGEDGVELLREAIKDVDALDAALPATSLAP